MAERITLQVKGSPVEAYLGLPDRPGRHPGIVLAHHRYGHASVVTRHTLDQLAALGCAAISIDHFHSVPPMENDLARIAAMKDSWIAADNEAAIDFLRNHAQVQPDNLAVMGHCLGGRIAFMAAAQFPIFKAAVIYYSTSMFRAPEGVAPAFEVLKNIKCPVIGFFGLEDKLIPVHDIDRIEAELARAEVRHEFHRYPEAGHAFCNFDMPEDYREAACGDAWEHTVAFLEKELKFTAR